MANALPTTPEVNEEHSGRSASPETKPQTDTAGIYTYGQSYSAYYPTTFKPKLPLKTIVKTKRKKPKQRCGLFRLSCCNRSRSGMYRVRNDTLPYFIRSSSVRPIGFNKISPQLSQKQIDVTKGRIRLNLYAYPKGYLKFLESYFVVSNNHDSTKNDRLPVISEEDVCPLCGGSVDYSLKNSRWKNALLVPF